MNYKCLHIYLFLTVFPFISSGQQLKPGFDKAEYRELMLMSVRSVADSAYASAFPVPTHYKMIYQSAPIGLDNSWDMWTNDDNTGVISLRGTTEKPESWLANFYAAMVPAMGEIKLSSAESFKYTLATNPKAAVHVGWVVSLAYLSKEIVPKINEQYLKGTREFLIMGHSQGGAIAFLLTSYLYHLQKAGQLPRDIRFKTYCSAAPKPGNLYYAYEYEAMTQGGWAFNVVNAADWVPEMPITVQTLNDFNNVNPFTNAEALIKSQKFPKNLVLRHIYNQLNNPTKKAQANYEKYLGTLTSKIIRQTLKEFTPPDYYRSSDYVRAGVNIILLPGNDYYKIYPDDSTKLFAHHYHAQYLYLLNQLPDINQSYQIAPLIYTPSSAERRRAKENNLPLAAKKFFLHTQIGIQIPRISLLNQELKQNGFLELNKIYLTRGGGFYTIFPKLRLASLFNYATYTSERAANNSQNSVRGTSVGTSLGILLIHRPAFHLIPYGGIVYSWYGVRLSRIYSSSQPFDNYLSGPSTQHHLTSEGFTVNLGAQLAISPFLNNSLLQKINVGLRSGYQFPFTKATRWKTDAHSLQGGPAINSHGFFCNLIIGLAI